MNLFDGINSSHVALAYTGMLLHILMKLAELNKSEGFKLFAYIKKNIFTIISSFIMIPVVLIMASDAFISNILPINNVTAVFAGWQVQSTFKSVMTFYSNRIKKTTEITTNEQENINNESDKG